MLNVASPTTSQIGDMMEIMTISKTLVEKVTITPVLNTLTGFYEDVIQLAGRTVYDDDVSDALKKLKEIEIRINDGN